MPGAGTLGWHQSCAPRGFRGAQDWGRRGEAPRDGWREVQPNRRKNAGMKSRPSSSDATAAPYGSGQRVFG